MVWGFIIDDIEGHHRWYRASSSMMTGYTIDGIGVVLGRCQSTGDLVHAEARRRGGSAFEDPLIYESTNPLIDYFTPKFSWMNFHIAARMWAFRAGSTTPCRDFG